MSERQVPKGYKQTEVGVIPEDWECNPLVGKILISHGYGFKSQYFCSYGKYQLTTPGNFYEEGGFRDLGERQKYYEGAVPSGYVLKQGDLIVAMTEQADGLLGSAAIIPESDSYLHNQRLGKINLISSDTDIDFLYYIFNSSAFRSKVQETAAGTKVKHTSPDKLLEIAVPQPPKEEQRAIAQTLSDVDALIAALDQLIAKQRHLKTATMQQLLTGKKRLPGFGGEWKEKQIGSEIDLLTGFPFPSAQYFDSGIKLLRGSNIKRGVTDWSDDLVQYWPEVTSDISQYVLNEGDIVIAMDGSLVGRSFARLSKDDLPALLLQRVARIRSDKIDMGYLKEWICSKFFTEHCDAVKTVTAIPHISPGDIRSFVIQVPPTQEEQREIATVLSDMDGAISALQARRAKTQAIKQGMMQELLTGRTRLV
ncbi:restriction endonuclease subunit S [Halomicronema sp. CCY15110]|uniref:restriction endonuclease subunit S n=1 Tax=Halomicronema sp. CCY15110 TaxID=2767773 RepID=UPI00195237B8|nr:restriction endonuclease subunit S [Halomicronema sp. CCY15110]